MGQNARPTLQSQGECKCHWGGGVGADPPPRGWQLALGGPRPPPQRVSLELAGRGRPSPVLEAAGPKLRKAVDGPKLKEEVSSLQEQPC